MRVRKGPSNRQREMLDFIRQFMTQHGLPPTVRDIQKACDISSTSVVDYNLRLLQRDGYLNRMPDVARGIELLDDSGRPTTAMLQIPITGYIAAGEPLPVFSSEPYAAENGLGTITVPPEMVVSNKPMYALKVKGMSMMDAFVTDGDIVLVENVPQAENGQMVVAWLRKEEEATLKRLYREGSRVRLQPANTQMEPIYSEAENVEVQGRVVGVLRMLA